MRTACISANTAWYLHNFRRETIQMIQAKGYRVVCVCPTDAYSKRLEVDLGVDVMHLAMDHKGTNPVRDLVTIARMIAIYRRMRPRFVMHFTVKNNVYGGLAAASLRIPMINNISGLGTAFIHPGWVGTAVRTLYRISLPLAFRVFCQNEEDQKFLISNHLVTRERLILIPGSGVDLKRFQPSLRDADINRPFLFLYTGRMLADKGLYELVQAFMLLRKDCPGCQLWLAGYVDAVNRSAIGIQTIREWEKIPGIVFKGEIDRIEELLREADCVVLPSYREGLPRSLLEAAAMALPLIATDVPGCRSVVRDGETGLLCKAKDVESLTDAMKIMIRMQPEARKILGEAGRRLVEAKFDVGRVVNAYRDVIDAIEREVAESDPPR